ncbi:PQQ-binding-like beta-propeller repeat protein [Pedobacter sp. KR3-3]|uniref:PQQ-binding-like beta-propeller repeat protein n=1 Tax=Pedobacter albus TaxID=3113905 RepID=A0ABU7I3W5_9SPHI|nr:PQQ-binding-like beta-propeller repeat protein [Pedobacter sp. KR3-3]MEE1944074.1 PQQ-binding-like beta-propeller repeat protein [Pedobacter sp. KR3-3]
MKKTVFILSMILFANLYVQAQAQQKSTTTKKTVSKKPQKPASLPPPPKPIPVPTPPQKAAASIDIAVATPMPAPPTPMAAKDDKLNPYSNNKILTADDIVTTQVTFKVNTADKLHQDALLIYGNNGTVVSFDLVSKKTNWTYKESNIDNNSANRFTVENATAYIPFVDGSIIALNLNTGKAYWKAKIGFNRDKMLLRRQTALTHGDLLYVAARNSNFYALNKVNGEMIWNYKLPYEYNIYPPILSNDEIFINNAPYVYKFDAQVGKAIWQRNFGKAMYAKMVTDGQRIYACNESSTLFAIDPSGQSTIDWQFNLADNQYGVDENIIVKQGTIYLAGKGGPSSKTTSVYALKASDGQQLWKTDFPAEKIETIDWIDEKIIGYLKDQLFVLDAKTGKELFKTNPTEKPISNIVFTDAQTLLYVSKNGVVTYNLGNKQLSLSPVAALKIEKTDNQTYIQRLKAN